MFPTIASHKPPSSNPPQDPTTTYSALKCVAERGLEDAGEREVAAPGTSRTTHGTNRTTGAGCTHPYPVLPLRLVGACSLTPPAPSPLRLQVGPVSQAGWADSLAEDVVAAELLASARALRARDVEELGKLIASRITAST